MRIKQQVKVTMTLSHMETVRLSEILDKVAIHAESMRLNPAQVQTAAEMRAAIHDNVPHVY